VVLPVVVVMVEPPDTIVATSGLVVTAEREAALAPLPKTVVLPTVDVMVEPPEVTVVTMALVVMAELPAPTPPAKIVVLPT